MRKEFGDRVADTFKAVGIEKKEGCGCHKKQETLNNLSRMYSRRGLLKGSTLLLAIGWNKALWGAWKVAGAEPPIPLTGFGLLGFVRTHNSVQAKSKIETDKFLDSASALSAVAGHKEHFTPDRGGYEWASKFTPGAPGGQVLPNWTFRHRLTESGYVTAVVGADKTYLSDEIGGIYISPSTNIDIASISHAADVPDALGIGDPRLKFDDANLSEPTAWDRMKSFFVPTVYAAISCSNCTVCWTVCTCCRCCYQYGCTTCLNRACGGCNTAACSYDKKPGCVMNLGCIGGGLNCVWYITPPSSTCLECQPCADFWGTCCICSGSPLCNY